MKQVLIITLAMYLSACGSTPTKYKHSDKRTTIITQNSIVYENDKTDSPSIAIVTIAPNYPVAAAKNLVTGFVELSFVINEGGSVINVEVLNSSPRGIFDKGAIRAMSKWKFKPAFHNNEVVLVKMTHVMSFELNDTKE